MNEIIRESLMQIGKNIDIIANDVYDENQEISKKV
jgi:hypothetical protein|nr:MAG TPA: hypothetical protein [Caudoviricetes sp.]DAN67429.1 MAG TPA: hypothetical protein [Caudoviricetes sp.]